MKKQVSVTPDFFIYWDWKYTAIIPLVAINLNFSYVNHSIITIGFRWGPFRVGLDLEIIKAFKYGGS